MLASTTSVLMMLSCWEGFFSRPLLVTDALFWAWQMITWCPVPLQNKGYLFQRISSADVFADRKERTFSLKLAEFQGYAIDGDPASVATDCNLQVQTAAMPLGSCHNVMEHCIIHSHVSSLSFPVSQ